MTLLGLKPGGRPLHSLHRVSDSAGRECSSLVRSVREGMPVRVGAPAR